MNRSEIILVIIAIVAYIIGSLIFNIPMEMHIIFIALVIVLLLATLVLKYQQKFVNEKVSNYAQLITKILFIILVLTIVSGAVFKHALFNLYQICIILMFISLFVGWFFKKEED